MSERANQDPAITPEIHDAYRRTIYRVSSGEASIDIRVGECVPDLNTVLELSGANSWVFVTAFNPKSNVSDHGKNIEGDLQLSLRIAELDFSVLPCNAIDPAGKWPVESGYLVLGMDRETGLNVAREFGQNAIVCGAIGEKARLEFC